MSRKSPIDNAHQTGTPVIEMNTSNIPNNNYINQYCQQIAQQNGRWKDIPVHLRKDWTRCLNEIRSLEEKIENEKKSRFKWSRYLKWGSYLITLLFNIYSAAQIIIYATVTEASKELTLFLSIINGAASLSFWGPLQKQSNKYLIEAKDLKALSILCSQMRGKLKKILQDGKIDFNERLQVINMIGEIHRASQEIGEFDIFLKIISGSDSENPFSKSKEYQHFFKNVDNIVGQLSGTQGFVERQVPNVVHDYQMQNLFNPNNQNLPPVVV